MHLQGGRFRRLDEVNDKRELFWSEPVRPCGKYIEQSGGSKEFTGWLYGHHRLRGLAKNTGHLFTLFGLANLVIAKRTLLAC
jgi:hypothetical protein